MKTFFQISPTNRHYVLPWILHIPSLVLLASLAACRPEVPPTPDPETTTVVQQEAPVDNSLTMRGIDLYMHRPNNEDGVSGKPEMWVRADTFSIEGNQKYRFENARAVIYSKGEQEEITIEARSGSFEQDANAVLDGDVRMTAGTLHLLASNIEWTYPEDGTQGMAHSESPVIIDDPDLQLNAGKLRLYPDTQQFELLEVSGVVRFGKELL